VKYFLTPKDLSQKAFNPFTFFLTYYWDIIREVGSKPQLRFKGKAQADEKARSANVLWRTIILNRLAEHLDLIK
jgi:hypothetical protein